MHPYRENYKDSHSKWWLRFLVMTHELIRPSWLGFPAHGPHSRVPVMRRWLECRLREQSARPPSLQTKARAEEGWDLEEATKEGRGTTRVWWTV